MTAVTDNGKLTPTPFDSPNLPSPPQDVSRPRRRDVSGRRIPPLPPVAVPGAPPGTLPTPASTPQPDVKDHASGVSKEHQAGIVRRLYVPVTMMITGGLGAPMTVEGYLTFMEEVLRDAGDPTDPLERMLIEQLTLCHVRLANLYSKTAETQTIEAAAVYNAMSIRLAGEFRKLTLAVEKYRTDRQARLNGGKDVEQRGNSRQRTGK